MRYLLIVAVLFGVVGVHCGQPVVQDGESGKESVTEGNISTQEMTGAEEGTSTAPDTGASEIPAKTDHTEDHTTDASVLDTQNTPPEPGSEPTVTPDTSVSGEAQVEQEQQAPESTLPEGYSSWLAQVSCQTPAPAGATLAQSPPAFSGGTCPQLQPGMNTITSKGNARKFILVLPSNAQPGEVYPVLFMWHWLKSSASKFLTQGEVQSAVDQQRFIALIPEAKGDLDMIVTKVPWPFLAAVPQTRYEEEYIFFDDMLSCVSQQFKVNKECVSTVGVSAGALFTAQLAQARSQYLSSFLSLSGGTDEPAGIVAKVGSWKSTAHKLPALVLWGGPQDSCVLLNFEKASKALENHLKKDGHFFIECIHNCQHAEPPITPNAGKSKYESLWDFFLRHPFWLKPGESPYLITSWPYANVPWCGIGAGSAKSRTGSCPPPACPI